MALESAAGNACDLVTMFDLRTFTLLSGEVGNFMWSAPLSHFWQHLLSRSSL
jgi:hypothetical protein